jgi:hypothetical protein
MRSNQIWRADAQSGFYETLCSETRSLTSTAAIPNTTIQHENDNGGDTSDGSELLTKSVILAIRTVRIVAPMVE